MIDMNSAPGRIAPLAPVHLPQYAEVIRQSFATVATAFGLTQQNCPTHTSFITDERLASKYRDGYYPLGYFTEGKIIGFVALTETGEGVYELSNLSVLPEYRHYGYGRELLDFCKEKVRELSGSKITISIIEDHTVLKSWYAANGFVHTGTRKFDHFPFMVGFMEWSAV